MRTSKWWKEKEGDEIQGWGRCCSQWKWRRLGELLAGMAGGNALAAGRRLERARRFTVGLAILREAMATSVVKTAGIGKCMCM